MKDKAPIGKKRTQTTSDATPVNSESNKSNKSNKSNTSNTPNKEISNMAPKNNKSSKSSKVTEKTSDMKLDKYIENQLSEHELDISVSAVKSGIKSMLYKRMETDEDKVDKFIYRNSATKRVTAFSSKETVGVDFAVTNIGAYVKNDLNVIDETRGDDIEIGKAGNMLQCEEDGQIWNSKEIDECPSCGGEGRCMPRQSLPKGYKIMKKDGSGDFDGSAYNYRLLGGLIRADGDDKWAQKSIKVSGTKLQLLNRMSPGTIFGINVEASEYNDVTYYATTGTSTFKGLYGEDITFSEIFEEQTFDEESNEIFAHISRGKDITEDGFHTMAFEIMEAPYKAEGSDMYKIVMQDILSEDGIVVINFWTDSKAMADKLTPRETDDAPLSGIFVGRISKLESIDEDEINDECQYGWTANLNITDSEFGIPLFLYVGDELVNIDEYVIE